VTHRMGRLWIRRTAMVYDVMFAPTGNGEFRINTEDGLREEAVVALRCDAEHDIPNVVLTLERMSKLGL
jgi:hypothetical protein